MLYIVAGLFGTLLLGGLAGFSGLLGGAATTTALDDAVPAAGRPADGALPLIASFDPRNQRLVLSYIPAGGRPMVTVAPDPDGLGNGIVFADGRAIAVIGGGAGMSPTRIELEPAAVARIRA